MSDHVKRRRRYESPRRQEQARETRRRILEAARDQFLADGYARTTIASIAQQAGVTAQTVYVAFSTKRAILAALLDVAIGGDEQPVGVLERPEPRRMRDEPDQRRQLEMMARGIHEILERAGPVFDVMRGGASVDPEIGDLYRRLEEERLRNMKQVVRWVAEKGPLRDEVGVDYGADMVWTLTSAEVHRLLRGERGWSGERYERWLADSLIAALLP